MERETIPEDWWRERKEEGFAVPPHFAFIG